jgi:hypothetical protein
MAKLKGAAGTFYLPATESAQHPRATLILAPLTLVTNLVNVSGSLDNRDFVRSAGAAGWGIGWANSAAIAGGARCTFRATAGLVTCGLNADIAGAATWTAIDYALVPRGNGVLSIFESGADRGDYGTWTSTDLLSVVYDDGSDTVSYYRNGERLRSVSAPSGLALRFDAQFYDVGAAIGDVSFGGPGPAAGAAAATLVTTAAAGDVTAPEGWMMTALLEGGGAQLVVVTADGVSDSGGAAVVSFTPPLRKRAFGFVTGRPWGEMAMDGPELGYSVDPGAIYGFGFSATEAF